MNANDFSCDGKRCTCMRAPMQKHAEDCAARKQCPVCPRNLFEPHADGCSYVNFADEEVTKP